MKKLLCLSACALLMAACSKKNDPINNARQAVKDKDLQEKTFVSTCSVTPGKLLATLGGVKSEQIAYRFSGSRVTRTTRGYTSIDCSGDAAGTFEETGAIDINKDEKFKTNDGGYNINEDFDSLKVTIATPEGAAAANTAKLCGQTNWAPKQNRDVTAQAKDTSCYGAPLPRHVANIYRVDDKKVLYLGADGKTAIADNARPKSLMADKFTAQ